MSEIFKDFESPQRKTSSAPSGNQTPTLPKHSKAVNASSSSSKDAASFACSSSKTETSRAADSFSPEQRQVMARFSNNTNSPQQKTAMENLMERDRSKTSLLVAELRRDAARMRKNEEREKLLAKTSEENREKSLLLANDKNDDDTNSKKAPPAAAADLESPFDDFDESQLGRYANLASSARNKAIRLEISKRVGKEEEADRLLLCQEQEDDWIEVSREVLKKMLQLLPSTVTKRKRVVIQDASSSCSSSDVDASSDETFRNNDQEHLRLQQQQKEMYSNLSSLTTTTTTTKTQDGEQASSLLTSHHEKKEDESRSKNNKESSTTSSRKVTFSHLSTRRAGKMTKDDAAIIIQRQARRYASVASTQRYLSLLHLLQVWKDNNNNNNSGTNSKASDGDDEKFLFTSAMQIGSVCTCPTAVNWLRTRTEEDEIEKEQSKNKNDNTILRLIACRTEISRLPYKFQCLLAAALEYEVRLHSENLSQVYIAADEEEERKNRRGTRSVSRLSAEEKKARKTGESEEYDKNNTDESEAEKQQELVDQEKDKKKRVFNVLRKSVLPQSEAEEILNMLKTAVLGERFHIVEKKQQDDDESNHEQEENDVNDDPSEKDENGNHENSSMQKLAARWVVDSLEPFSSSSFCELLGGVQNHEASATLLLSSDRNVKLEGISFENYHNHRNQQQQGKNSTSSSSVGTSTTTEDEKENKDFSSSTSIVKKSNNNKKSSSENRNPLLGTSDHYFYISLPPSSDLMSSCPVEWTSLFEENESKEDLKQRREHVLDSIKKWASIHHTHQSKNNNNNKTDNNNDNKTDEHDLSLFLHDAPVSKEDENDKTLTIAANPEEFDEEKKRFIRLLKNGGTHHHDEDEDNQEQSIDDEHQQQLVKFKPLSEDEKHLLAELGNDDPLIAEMIYQIENAEDEELRAVQAETDRRLSFAQAIQKAAAATMKKMNAVSMGCGTVSYPDGMEIDDDEVEFKEEEHQQHALTNTATSAGSTSMTSTQSTKNWLPINDEVRKHGAVISSVGRQFSGANNNSNNSIKTKAEQQQSSKSSAPVVSKLCVICELDEDDTLPCSCGSYFHRDCGVENKCCEACN